MIIIFSYQLFFISLEILGYRYEGSESSPIYYIYIAGIFLLTIIVFSQDLMVSQIKLTKKDLILMLLVLSVFISFSFDTLVNGLSQPMTTRFIYFMVWSFTSILMGIYLSKSNRYKSFIKFADILEILINIALVRSVSYSLLNNTSVSLGGATYQNAGYVFALGFGINLFFLVYGRQYNRFKFTMTRLYKLLSIVFLFIQLYGAIATGARGAMILIVFYLLLIFVLSMVNIKTFIKYFFILIVFGVLFYLSWPIISEVPLISNSWDRVFAYIGKDGINWEGTSGRDIVYGDALRKISEKPISGYGFFNYLNIVYPPHNIFLEALIQGGVIYLTIFLIVLVLLFYKFCKVIKINKRFLLYAILFSYPVVMLMFSGSYMSNALFWFMLSFVLTLDIKKVKLDVKM